MSNFIATPTTKIRCHRCGHLWNYTGNNAYIATCPHCSTKVTLRNIKGFERNGNTITLTACLIDHKSCTRKYKDSGGIVNLICRCPCHTIEFKSALDLLKDQKENEV